jgi:uncharacterized protein (TIGR01244 family)
MRKLPFTDSRVWLIFLLVVLLGACAPVSVPDARNPELSSLANLRNPEPGVLSSAQPTEAEFRALARSGVRHIVNLRPASEQPDFDEAALVRSLGMEYHSLPVAGGADVTPENARKLDSLLAELGNEPVLLHCATGNRVGALRAMTARQNGLEVEAALEEGGRWGLTGMTPTVREILNNQ